MSQRQSWKTVGAFVIGVMVALIGGELTIRVAQPVLPAPLEWPNRTAQAKHELLSDLEDSYPEVVFVGSSAVAAALEPSLFSAECGLSAFNAAIDGASPVALETWLQNAVLESGTPEWVVIGLTSRELRPSEDSVSYVEALAARDDPLARLEKSLAERFRSLEYRSVLRDPARWVPWAPPEDDTLEADGYPGNEEGSYSIAAFEDASTTLLRDFEPSEAELDALRRIVEDVRDRGVGVVFANMAVSEDWPDLHPRGSQDHEAYRRAVDDLAAEFDVPLLDLDDFDDPSLFHDPIHVDAGGAQLETTALAARFPDCS